MKRYLNAEEKNDICILAALKVFLDEHIPIWSGLGKSTKHAKMARTYTEKVMQAILQPLDPKERDIVVNQSAKVEVVTRTRAQILLDIENMKKQKENRVIAEDDFTVLCEFGFVVCNKCKKSDYMNCTFRDVLMRHDIEAMDLEAGPEVCQYKYELEV